MVSFLFIAPKIENLMFAPFNPFDKGSAAKTQKKIKHNNTTLDLNRTDTVLYSTPLILK
jgi:hypothetical protein